MLELAGKTNFTQSRFGCLKKCHQLFILLSQPSHNLRTSLIFNPPPPQKKEKSETMLSGDGLNLK